MDIALVEDQKLVARTLADALSSHGVNVVAVAHNAFDAVRAVKAGAVDALLTDLDLGDGPNGTQLAVRLRATHPKLGIVVLTGLEDPKLLAGNAFPLPRGSVYLVKHTLDNVEHIARAIELSVEYATGKQKIPESVKFPLTMHQATILRLVSLGLSNKAIADHLVMSVHSVESAIKRLAKTLGLRSDGDTNMRVMLAQKFFHMSGRPFGR
jgi:DNA-binding NarL/FixJ family response regulator